MSLFPLADCARSLGIHPKTLCQRLKQDPLELSVHPRDARIKCLTAQQVEQLAVAYDRAFPFPSEQTTMLPDVATEIQVRDAARTALPISQEEASLSQQISLLETRIAQLSEQVAHLTLALLQERERTVERRLSDLETVVQELTGVLCLSPPSPAHLEAQIRGEGVSAHVFTRPLIEAELRADPVCPH